MRNSDGTPFTALACSLLIADLCVKRPFLASR
jgi:hypothetical protein